MIFEVCCGCLEDAVNAYLGGADRIELNSSLFLGGLTPSLGTLLEVKERINMPVMAMVRPREAGFRYSEYDYRTMLRDAKMLLENGADGLVFGFLKPDGTIDTDRTEEFTEICRSAGKEAVFSRAVDVTPNICDSVGLLEEIGVTRVLTSGAKPSAIEGREMIKKLREMYDKIQILPGGGIRSSNVSVFVRCTGVSQVHASARTVRHDSSVDNNPSIYFGGSVSGNYLPENEYKVTSPEAVREMKRILNEF